MQNAGKLASDSPLPTLREMPRVARDIEQILSFISRQPWGRAADRERDIYRGFHQIRSRPRYNRISVVRPTTGIELRRHDIAQFAIIYAYIESNIEHPCGIVSIRAVRHRRVKNVFTGVREPPP